MRAVVQRVADARVSVNGRICGRIDRGLLVYLGVAVEDSEQDVRYTAEKVAALRIFPDSNGKMNLSVRDAGGAVLVVSQFTLYGDARRGRRPSYASAADPDKALRLYRNFAERIQSLGLHVETGQFAAPMEVQYTNVGPVTILLDSTKLF
jgi:D-tyrosyl-tRNA(Tyr) deacylase